MKQEEMKRYTIEQFINTETVSNNSLSGDGKKVLFSSDRSGIFNVYTTPVEGGDALPLTTSTTDSIFAISYLPNDDRFLYLSDKGGNEISHIYLRNLDGTSTDLTPGEKERALFYQWSKDGKSFIYGSNKRDPKYMDVYEMDVKSFESKLLFENKEGLESYSISDNHRLLALVKTVNANSTHMYIYNCDTEELNAVTSHTEDIKFIPQAFSQEGKSLYYLTDEDHEFMYVKKMDLETGESEEIYKTNWAVTSISFTDQYSYMIISVNEDAYTKVKIMNTKTNDFLPLPELEGQLTDIHFSKDETAFSFLLNGSTSPSNLFVYDLDNQNLLQLTDTLNPEISQEDLIKVEVVRYPSFDGLDIPAIYYKPKGISESEKVPALVWVHGGPGGQSRVDYNPLLQYLANHGYAVIAVNNRGSSGYGKSFFQMADLKHGEVDLADCIEAKKFLASTGYVDDTKIGIIGHSYGGYMTLAALAFQPEEFKVGVDIFGVSNWVRTLKSIPSWWETMRDALYKKLGDPFTSEEYLRSISPLFHAENITKPLIVLQGSNDPRVLQVESDEIVEVVKKNDVPVEYLVFDDEGHGFTKKKNIITGYEAILEFLEEYLKK